MHILPLNCSILIVSLFSYLPLSRLPVTAPHSGFHLSYPFGLCLRFLPALCHISCPLHPAAHKRFLCLLLTWPFFISCLPALLMPFLCFDLFFFCSRCCFAHIHFPHSYSLCSESPPLCYLSPSMAPYPLSVQCPWGSSPHPFSRCSMPPAGQAWVQWASPSSCWPTTSRWRSQRWMSITMRWTLSPTSAHEESTGSKTCEDCGYTFIWSQSVFLIVLVCDVPH